MGRFSDIRRGKELNEALTKLRAWEDKPRDQKQALYKQQRGLLIRMKAIRVMGYVEAFGFTERIFLPVRLLSDTQTGNEGGEAPLIDLVRSASADDDRTRDATSGQFPAGSTKLDGLTGFRPARLAVIKKGDAVQDNKSRITDIEYKRYANKTVSSPFGRKNATEKYAEAVEAIKEQQAIKPYLVGGNRVAFTPEIL